MADPSPPPGAEHPPGPSAPPGGDAAAPGAIDAMAGRVVGTLARAGLTLAVAESCTGGLLGGAITTVPGASRVFLGGIVCYADEAKVRVLGVDAALIERCGAVSEEVAAALADRALDLFGSDAALAITGIAGPSGARPGKPVGLVCVGGALRRPGGDARTALRRFVFDGDRGAVRRQAVEAALRLMEDLAGTGGR